jgi:hypothetical protein
MASLIDRLSSLIYKPIEKKTMIPMPLITWSSDLETKQLHPYYGVVSGTYYAMTGMPWLSSDARKAVMTEWFWQPIRGQPRRVDTNELRKYSNTIWVQSIVMTILNQIWSIPWDLVPKEGKEYAGSEEEIGRVKEFFNHPVRFSYSVFIVLESIILGIKFYKNPIKPLGSKGKEEKLVKLQRIIFPINRLLTIIILLSSSYFDNFSETRFQSTNIKAWSQSSSRQWSSISLSENA